LWGRRGRDNDNSWKPVVSVSLIVLEKILDILISEEPGAT
jgi:hypothetical protein